MHDVVIAGGGPAGLAAAIRSARRGFRTLVLERSEGIPDKACGEGLMPRGAEDLERLGVRVPDDRCAPFRGIRYLQEDGTILEACFRGRPGVGIRRTALVEALREVAASAGGEVRRGSVVSARPRGDVIDVETDAGHIEARLVIAADGLHSPLRRAAGLESAAGSGPLRFGVRQHFALAPWTDLVEVHWASGVEAYVTPVGPRTVNVALPQASSRICWHLSRGSARSSRAHRSSRRCGAPDHCCSVRGRGGRHAWRWSEMRRDTSTPSPAKGSRWPSRHPLF